MKNTSVDPIRLLTAMSAAIGGKMEHLNDHLEQPITVDDWAAVQQARAVRDARAWAKVNCREDVLIVRQRCRHLNTPSKIADRDANNAAFDMKIKVKTEAAAARWDAEIKAAADCRATCLRQPVRHARWASQSDHPRPRRVTSAATMHTRAVLDSASATTASPKRPGATVWPRSTAGRPDLN